jgi:dihydroflavonol-4-reductase
MDFIKKIITGKVPMLPKANGKRFIVTTEKSYAMQSLAQIIKSNGYNKVSTTLAPTFLLKFVEEALKK